MQALLQTAHEMLQSIQALLETSQATVPDAGNADSSSHAASDVVAASKSERRKRSTRRGEREIYADVHAREGSEEGNDGGSTLRPG
jgi:hypothetical protein